MRFRHGPTTGEAPTHGFPKANRHQVTCWFRANDCALKGNRICVGQLHECRKHLHFRRVLKITASSRRTQENSSRSDSRPLLRPCPTHTCSGPPSSVSNHLCLLRTPGVPGAVAPESYTQKAMCPDRGPHLEKLQLNDLCIVVPAALQFPR